MLNLLFCKSTTHKYCFKCEHWTGFYIRKLKYKKSFKFLRWKYWKYLFAINNFCALGQCNITLICGEHEKFFTKGYEKCLFSDIKENIYNTRDFINKLSDDPIEMADEIDEIENAKRTNNIKTSINS